ncbi:hypothetical protein [Yersinia bercovieri]|uniref:hypothetical protein n=1 Tax=Yersinia bercovieri TaxID=634 RepID=UPI00070AEFA2|nr:hypothetical protein [Yersinia bercovieri]
MRKILNKLFATAIDNYYHSFALRDKANSFRLLTGKHDIAHIASSVFKPARVLAFFLPCVLGAAAVLAALTHPNHLLM